MILTMLLPDLPKGTPGIVVRVDDAHASDAIAQRLRDLGFVPGEPVRVVASAPWGADPILIQIGSTRFALRQNEASRITVRADVSSDDVQSKGGQSKDARP